MDVKIADTTLNLSADRSAWWPDCKTLFIADTHFGKAAAFRRAGLPVPVGTTTEVLARLSSAIDARSAERLIVLGDLIHCGDRTETDFLTELRNWREQHPSLEWTLVRGNHDRGHKGLFAELRIDVVDEPFELGPFELCHYPDAMPRVLRKYRLAGHMHPGLTLKELGQSSPKLPCFWFSSTTGVMPAFGNFVGHAAIQAGDDDQVFVIADDQLIRFTGR